MRIPVHSVLALLLVVACSSATASGDEARVVGAIAGYTDGDPHVDVPTTAQRGVPFPVTVRTYGGGCHREGDTQVRVTGMTADVTPYDITRLHVGCTRQLVTLTHTAAVRFDAAGTARVRVHGRGLHDEDVLVERLVRVQ